MDIIFYFHKRYARSTWPPVSLPIRPEPLSVLIAAELTTATTRITLAIGDWLQHTHETALSSTFYYAQVVVTYTAQEQLHPYAVLAVF
jgi:hypothetical protein